MLFVEVDNNKELQFRVESPSAVKVEVIQNGEKVAGFETSKGKHPLTAEGTSWIAVRCSENRQDGRSRWAHSAPIWIDVPGKPIRARTREVEFFIRRMQSELDRNKDVLTPEGLAEYQEALDYYKGKLKEAR
jgi:hypothetical protein